MKFLRAFSIAFVFIALSCTKTPTEEEKVKFSSYFIEATKDAQEFELSANRKYSLSFLYEMEENGEYSLKDEVPLSERYSDKELTLSNEWIKATRKTVNGNYFLLIELEENNTGNKRTCEIWVDYPISGRRVRIIQNK